ncbi:TPA: hypothetical protein DIC20_03500 [Candidatus Dependentiae bacterium]|nr:MAG: hypothetical protein US03_C0001G0087 [candidate division TM6 bacterium GW2011_GWF2_36_131]KKQ03777.1 MAG: hypothetical protein US13_C0001G0117 [candidate division TM6 bacterium GW2011_GWE2_36_25]KKQ19922.1 MAG: hypothetical protein US32_C0003G0039 [candidate division TM6 bacterium GW2011_GWA2_36_9]HBR70543.1 hypothetical protein [Candidatus Dependentiae bacterium]HCU00741.1 hypothetical protein [Candidatus Dependentiae bacterium]
MKKFLIFFIGISLIFSAYSITAETYGLLFKIADIFIGEKVCLRDLLKGLKVPDEKLPQGGGFLGDFISRLCLENFEALSEGDKVGAQGKITLDKIKVPVTLFLVPVEKDDFDIQFVFRQHMVNLEKLSAVFDKIKNFFDWRDVAITFVRRRSADKDSPRIKISMDVKFKFLGDSDKNWLRLELLIPRNVQSMDSVQMNITSLHNEPVKICLADIFNKVDGGMVKKVFGNFCLVEEQIGLQVKSDGLVLNISGMISVFDKNVKGYLYVNKPFDGNACITLETKSDSDSDLGRVSDKFSFLSKFFIFKKPNIRLSTCEVEKAGLSLDADIEFKDFLGKFFNTFGLSTVHGSVGIPAHSAQIDQLYVEFQKSLDNPKEYGPVKMKSFGFRMKGGVPSPFFGLNVNAELKTKSGVISFDLSGDLNPVRFDLKGLAHCKEEKGFEKVCPVLSEPFGFPFVLTDPGLIIHVADGLLTGLGMQGKMRLGESDLLVNGDINVADPLKSTFIAKTHKFCLTDLASLWISVANKVGKKIKVPPLRIPGIGCFKDTEIRFGMSLGVPDVFIIASFDFLGLAAHVEGNLNVAGLSLLGNVAPVSVPALFAMASKKDSQQGPVIDLQLNLFDQYFKLDGKISLLNGLIAREQQIDFSNAILTFELVHKLFGLGTNLKFTLPMENLKSFGDWSAEGEFENGFKELLLNALTQRKSGLEKDIREMVDKATNRLCGKLPPISKKTCQIFYKSAKGIASLSDQLRKKLYDAFEKLFKTFGIKRAHFKTTLKQLGSFILPDVEVELYVLGDTIKLSLKNFDLKNPLNSLTNFVDLIMERLDNRVTFEIEPLDLKGLDEALANVGIAQERLTAAGELTPEDIAKLQGYATTSFANVEEMLKSAEQIK